MFSERDAWAEALKVVEMHEDVVDNFLLQKVTALSEQGDQDGVTFWLVVSSHVAELLDTPDKLSDFN